MDLSFMYKASCDEAKAVFLCLMQKKKSQIRLNLRLLAEMVGILPRAKLPHFEFYPLRSTQWNIVEVIRLYRKIQTIEITLKISSKSERSRLHADLNPLEKSAKNPPKREN